MLAAELVCVAELVVNCPSNADESIVVPLTVHIMAAWLSEQLGLPASADIAAQDIRSWVASQGSKLSLTIK